MADVFISYARIDKALVAPLVAVIEAQGWSVWWDPEIATGQEFDRQIAAELKIAAAVLVVWTPNSVGSRWVRGEAREGAERGILVPVRFAGADLPIDVRALHTTEFDDWGEDPRSPQIQEVIRALDATIGRQRATQPATANPDQELPNSGPRRIGICVLPFANMSGDPEQEYFSDGITEDIITDLSKVSALAVISRNSAFVFKGKNIDVQRVARELKVGHVLEGSVRKAGGRVRITAQLVDAASNDHVWAERYDRDLNDIFALQDEISQAIVKALKLKLLPEEKKAIEQRGTDNVEAYNLYLMARQYYITGNEWDAGRAEAIVRLCIRATELDPDYARAWALMAIAQMTLHFFFGRHDDNGLVATERALALDANLAEAHAVKGRILSGYGRHDEASAEIDIALRLDSESYDVHRCAGKLRYRQHRFEDAIRHYAKAVAVMESDIHSSDMLASCYAAVGNHEAAMGATQITFSRAEIALAQDPNNGVAMAFGAGALVMLGEVERGKEWMARALLIDPTNANARYNFACSLSIDQNQTDAALEILRPVFATMAAALLIHVKVDPDLDPIREDPRFKAMLADAEARLATANDRGSTQAS
jgi:adenylate cyclase